eukprot:SM000110S18884  [mRNA]  locus=s110:64200:66041:- [translate_table: standard]
MSSVPKRAQPSNHVSKRAIVRFYQLGLASQSHTQSLTFPSRLCVPSLHPRRTRSSPGPGPPRPATSPPLLRGVVGLPEPRRDEADRGSSPRPLFEESRGVTSSEVQRPAMPTLNIQTNVPADGVVTSDILKDGSKAVSKIIGKPESYVMVSLKAGVPMSFGGSEEPTAYGEVVSIGGLDPETNKKLSAAICDILQSKLSVPPNRVYIKFYDVKRSDFGWNGSTF